MTAAARARAARNLARNTLRRAVRRPRAWVRGARRQSAVVAIVRFAQRVREQVALALRARPRRRAAARAWTELAAQTAARPEPPPPTRTISIVTIASGEGALAAAARAAREAAGDMVCFLAASTSAVDPHWLERLASAIDGTGTVAAAPVLVHPLRSPMHATPHDGHVRASALEVEVVADAPAVRARDAGTIAAPGAPVAPIPAASLACLLVDRRAYSAAGMLESDDLDIAGLDLCRRLRAGGAEIVSVPDAVMVDNRPVASRAALTRPVPVDAPAWRAYVEQHGPALMHEARPLPAGKLRIALTTSAPSEKVAARWGDWHLAQAFADALRRRGHVVRVQALDHAGDLAGRASDVHCVIRGLHSVPRTAGQAHVLWVISHPESIEAAECDEADLVFVASERFADALRELTSTPVEVLLQATDAGRFRRVPAVAEHTHDVAIVAKSRDVFRAAVSDALAAGLRPAIYGSGWEPFVDPVLVVRDYVPNDELPIVYSSVGVLLNDHWQTMRDWGFVSNRLFDALACGTPVISEDLAEVDVLFAGAVPTYRDPAELGALVNGMLADRAGARERAARGGDLVRAQHTFDHRAEQFLDALRRHGLA